MDLSEPPWVTPALAKQKVRPVAGRASDVNSAMGEDRIDSVGSCLGHRRSALRRARDMMPLDAWECNVHVPLQNFCPTVLGGEGEHARAGVAIDGLVAARHPRLKLRCKVGALSTIMNHDGGPRDQFDIRIIGPWRSGTRFGAEGFVVGFGTEALR